MRQTGWKWKKKIPNGVLTVLQAAIGARVCVDSVRDVEGRRGEKGVEEDGMDEGEYTFDANERNVIV